MVHCAFGKGGDSEGGIDAEIRTDRGAVADVEVGVTEDAVVGIDDSVFRGVGHACSSDAVGRHGYVEEDLGDGGAGDATGDGGAQFSEAVGGGDVGGDGVAGRGKDLGEGPVPRAL